MVNGVFDPFSAPCDLTLQRGDPRFQLRDGQRVEILADQLRQRIVTGMREVVDLHGRQR